MRRPAGTMQSLPAKRQPQADQIVVRNIPQPLRQTPRQLIATEIQKMQVRNIAQLCRYPTRQLVAAEIR